MWLPSASLAPRRATRRPRARRSVAFLGVPCLLRHPALVDGAPVPLHFRPRAARGLRLRVKLALRLPNPRPRLAQHREEGLVVAEAEESDRRGGPRGEGG